MCLCKNSHQKTTSDLLPHVLVTAEIYKQYKKLRNMYPHIGKNPANLIVIISDANSKMTNGSFCKIDHIQKHKADLNQY